MAPFFSETMAQGAVETLSILTKGATTSCEKELKMMFCAQKFPVCNEIEETINWANQASTCKHVISKCPQKAKDILNAMRICEKLSQGKANINTCKVHLTDSDWCKPKLSVEWYHYFKALSHGDTRQFFQATVTKLF